MRIGNTNQNSPVPGLARREVVRAGTLLALAGTIGPIAGCGLFDDEPDPPPGPDPLAPLITGALDLAARYEAAIAAAPKLAGRLEPVAQAHRAHAAELSRITGTPLPSPSPTPPDGSTGRQPAELLAELRDAERQARDDAVKACVAAPADRAALVGSIAAARATHLEVLR